MSILFLCMFMFAVSECYCAYQFTDLVDDGDEVELLQDLNSSKILILNNSLSRTAMNNLYVEIERERDDFEFKKYISLRNALKNGEKTIDLGMKLEKGDEIKLKYFGKELLIGALTEKDSYFKYIDEKNKPEFVKEYGSDGYFHSYSKYSGFIDWTFEDYHHVDIVEAENNNTMPNGQPLPGRTAGLIMTISLIAIMFGLSHYLQVDKKKHC